MIASSVGEAKKSNKMKRDKIYAELAEVESHIDTQVAPWKEIYHKDLKRRNLDLCK